MVASEQLFREVDCLSLPDSKSCVFLVIVLEIGTVALIHNVHNCDCFIILCQVRTSILPFMSYKLLNFHTSYANLPLSCHYFIVLKIMSAAYFQVHFRLDLFFIPYFQKTDKT